MQKGLNKEIVKKFLNKNKNHAWMQEFRLKALADFSTKPMPSWGADLSELSPDDIYFYVKPVVEKQRDWNDVPQEIFTYL